jgi:hypothetical protein
MQLNLIPHPSALPAEPFELWANVDYAAAFGTTATLNIWFGISAPLSRFMVADLGEPQRRDGLWRTTCFEAFLRRGGGKGYQEWNFAPNGDWAAYEFADYRQDMREAEVAKPPYIRAEDNLTWWTLGATIAVPAGDPWHLGLSAVLEETDGTKSYWALAHCGDKPDFHDAGCFTARLA